MKVLVVYYGHKTTFIQRDIDILLKHFEVDEISIKRAKDVLALTKKIKNTDVVFIWFAGKHAGVSVFLTRLFGKRSIVVVGGYDAAKVSEINYGLWAVGSFVDKTLAKYALKNANKVIAVSKNLVNNLRKYANIKREISIVPTGYDYKFWKPANSEKENMVLTVAYIVRPDRIKVKGIDIFLKIAKKFPHTKFRVIGISPNMEIYVKKMIESENVEIYPPLSHSELLTHYQKAKVFSLLSRSEGLPNTLCEAMLCGCIPVVTNVGAMPEIVNGCGFVVEHDSNDIYNAIKKALEMPPVIGEKARKRIIKFFPEEKREEEIISLITKFYMREGG